VGGEVIGGRYRLRKRLGHGSMSEVWLAADEQLERAVAVKLLAPHADRRRFEREARAAASLSDANVERIYAYGEDEGRPYMVLEYLPGGTLEDRLAEGLPLPNVETAAVVPQIASGLAHAHAHGLVHRDLKPANVLFDGEGRAKIADFGIARLGRGDTFTEPGTVMGTAGYISPEQAAGRPASQASDVYSFGVILFRLLTGRLPFEGETALEVAPMHRRREPPQIESLRPDAPPHLAALATAAMAMDPRGRPQDGAALVAALGGAAPTSAETVVLPRPRGSRRRRGWRPTAMLAGVVLLAAGGVAAAVLTHGARSPGSNTTPVTRVHARRTISHATTAAPPPAPPPALPSAATTIRPTTTHTTRAAPTTTPPVTTLPPPLPTTVTPPTITAPPVTTTLPVPH
jgi:eukaryotic-like serine/threonine-protein kinase